MKRPRVVGAHEPPLYDDAICAALRAIAGGTATSGQQRAVLDWIVNKACLTYDLSYRPGADGARDTSFAEGRRFVGLQIVKLMRLVPVEPK